MTKADKWLLPDGVAELLPEQAASVEALRRKLLDCYRSWGYELVIPPMFEYLDSLHVGTGNDLALQTFTVTDQLSGRLLGLRADITPQAARMDAHSLKRNAPTRLCYSGTVLHSRAANLLASRELDQIGVELFGSASEIADLEVIEVMLNSIALAGALAKDSVEQQVKLDLGHVGIFRAVARLAGLNPVQEMDLCDILQRKARPELDAFIATCIQDAEASKLLRCLPDLCGEADVLQQAEILFSAVSDLKIKNILLKALTELKVVSENVSQQFSSIDCYFDLGELRGYDYHTGLVFAVYKSGYADALAKGGRYDAIGESFGRARPATGFSSDLRVLAGLNNPGYSKAAIYIPLVDRSSENFVVLQQKVMELRDAGEVLIQSLGNDKQSLQEERCNRELYFDAGKWEVKFF